MELVTLQDGLAINTLKMGLPENPPLILIHGFGSGIGQWVRFIILLFSLLLSSSSSFLQRAPTFFGSPADRSGIWTTYLFSTEFMLATY
jgi:pimeloyl-ACP methyl ester carboxylesterase